MKFRAFLLVAIGLALVVPGCSQDGIIARGGDFLLTVEQLRFEITKLGPSSGYDDTYEGRYAVVMNLAARKFLADEAEERGYGGEALQEMVDSARETALAESFRRWKVDNMVMLPRIKTKPWIEYLDRRLHIKDLVFLVHPVAEEALSDLREGVPVGTIEEAAAGRDDIRVVDMGWVIWKDLTREIANIVFRIGEGEASDVIAAGDGYHLFYVAEDEPFGLGLELLSVRSKRFVMAMEEERLDRELREELTDRYDVRFLEDGLTAGLRAFAVSFAGERPPDSLMAGVIASYPDGQVTVGDVYTLYFGLPAANRPYVGDYHSLSSLAVDVLMPDLEARAGYEMGLYRDREVLFAARMAREEHLVPMMEDYYKSQVEITPEDIAAYYENRKEDLAEPARYNVRRILVSSLEAARQARRQVLLGGDFAEVAMEVSEDERSAPQGGDMGWFSTGVVAVYDSVLADMEPGDISTPFQSYSGFEIIKLEGREARRTLSFEEATPQIKMYITNTRANEMLADFVNRKREEVGFTLNEELLREVWLPKPEYAPTEYEEAEPGEEEPPPALPKIG
jgi:parvulin-like peptidyl-prolyl isomerase